MALGAIILTGGAGSRMSTDKAALSWAGRRAVDRVAALAQAVGSQVVLTVGLQNYGLPLVRDGVPFGGPVGGVLSGVPILIEAGCDRVLVLAVDAPTIRASDIEALLCHDGAGATFEGLHLPMVVDIGRLPAEALADWPLARLLDRAGVARLACSPDAQPRLRGANTPDEQEVLLAELVAWEAAQKGGAG